MADKTHDVHQSADGKYRWVEGGGGIYRHDQAFMGAARDAHPATQTSEFIPLGMVVIRCRCNDPDSHANRGHHCEQGEVDVAESLRLSSTLNVNPPTPGV